MYPNKSNNDDDDDDGGTADLMWNMKLEFTKWNWVIFELELTEWN